MFQKQTIHCRVLKVEGDYALLEMSTNNAKQKTYFPTAFLSEENSFAGLEFILEKKGASQSKGSLQKNKGNEKRALLEALISSI